MGPDGPQTRRLAAVMFLDMVGFSAMMSRNETEALEHIRQLEKIMRAEVPSHGGRLVKFLGDGTLAEFPTAVSAVLCAKAVLASIQGPESKQAAPSLKVRIGLHLGELVEKDGDIFGDAVNIAARVQPLADPNGIAMSETVHAQVRNQMSLQGAYLPPQKLKNIPGRQRIYALLPEDASFHLWSIRRRLLPVALAALAAAAVVAAGFWLWNGREGMALRFSGCFFETPTDDPRANAFMKELEREFQIQGPRLKHVRWVDRAGIYETFVAEGVDLSTIRTGEAGACRLMRNLGVRFPINGYLRSLPDGTFQVDAQVTDTEDLTVVASVAAQGSDAAEIVRRIMPELQQWIDVNRKDFE